MLRANEGNGHQRRERVSVQEGQFYVIVNEWDGYVDGPHKQKETSYRIAIPGRRSVHVFDDQEQALRFAESQVKRLVEEQGDI